MPLVTASQNPTWEIRVAGSGTKEIGEIHQVVP